jgi:biopolymer transport protein ExbD
MRFRPLRRNDDELELNFVPLIDLLLVIIIFLMVATTFKRQQELQITLPVAQAEARRDRPTELLVGVGADGRYALEDRVLPFRDAESLSRALSEAAAGRKDPVVIINADAAASHQSVITVMEAARNAGIGRITFATTPSGNAAARR